ALGVAAVLPSRPGVLAALRVGEGDRVAQGDPLFEVRVDQRTGARGWLSEEMLRELGAQHDALSDSLRLEGEALAAALAAQDNRHARLRREIHALQALAERQARLDELEAAAWARARELQEAGAISRADAEAVEKRYLAARREL